MTREAFEKAYELIEEIEVVEKIIDDLNNNQKDCSFKTSGTNSSVDDKLKSVLLNFYISEKESLENDLNSL